MSQLALELPLTDKLHFVMNGLDGVPADLNGHERSEPNDDYVAQGKTTAKREASAEGSQPTFTGITPVINRLFDGF
ncbi:MAG: hypothetical protein ACTH8P_03940 [Ewingella sp.]|uniref:hypothetical protein n=1 Tax=Ewingella TaxID=41201 RepID=UPI0018126AE0|nr:hypothetical protein [Pseudomonas reactans]